MSFTYETSLEVDGTWIAEVVELPGVLAYGQSRELAMQKAQELARKIINGEDYYHSETSRNHMSLSILSVVHQIFLINWKIQNEFGKEQNIFVRPSAQPVLQEGRFDRQVSLSRTLRKWLKSEMPDGDLILAWANLCALLEGTMKAFLTVYFYDFEKDTENHSSSNAIHKKGPQKGTLKHPGKLRLEDLITYFRNQNLFDDGDEDLAKNIQCNRNAIHAFLDSPLEKTEQYQLALRKYLAFQRKLYDQMPG